MTVMSYFNITITIIISSKTSSSLLLTYDGNVALSLVRRVVLLQSNPAAEGARGTDVGASQDHLSQGRPLRMSGGEKEVQEL